MADITSFELREDDPVEAGATVATELVVPLLSQVLHLYPDPADKARFWTATLAALSGAMAADLGVEQAEVVLGALEGLTRRAIEPMESRRH